VLRCHWLFVSLFFPHCLRSYIAGRVAQREQRVALEDGDETGSDRGTLFVFQFIFIELECTYTLHLQIYYNMKNAYVYMKINNYKHIFIHVIVLINVILLEYATLHYCRVVALNTLSLFNKART
jgi:hypothetical protein